MNNASKRRVVLCAILLTELLLFLSEVNVSKSLFWGGIVQWSGQQSRARAYIAKRDRMVTNYEQLITLRWLFIAKHNQTWRGHLLGCVET